MKRKKDADGITLIALIITIIVLLILAVVAIGAVQDSRIIEYGENAATDYDIAKLEEEDFLSEYEDLINLKLRYYRNASS